MPAPVPVLRAVDEVTASWLTAALAEGGRVARDTAVGEVTVAPLGPRVGFLGDIARLHVTYVAGEGPATLIAKTPTRDPGGLAVGRQLGVWARESLFYADLADRTPARVPTCFYNGADAAAERWLLLLEDCGGPEVDSAGGGGVSHEQATAAIDELIRLHAAFWGGPRPASWLPGFDRGPFDALQSVVEAAVPVFVERFGSLLPEETPPWLAAFAPRLARWAAEEARGPLTLVHADYRSDNLLFRSDPAGAPIVTVIDWQTALVGPGAMDLASFLATSLTVADRRRWEERLVARYAAGVGVAVSEVTDRYRSHLLWWMALYASNYSRLEPATADEQANVEAVLRRAFTAAADHRVGDLLGAGG